MTPIVLRQFKLFVDDFLAEYFAVHPETATAAGIHAYDHLLTDFTQRGIARDVTRLKRALSRLKQLERSVGSIDGLPPQLKMDFQILTGAVEAALFDLEEMRPWERNPGYYNDLLFHSVFVFTKRDFAPLNKRVAAIIARERQIPAALDAARRNLRRVPIAVAQLAIRQCEGTLRFLQHSLPQFVRSVGDIRLQAQFEKSDALAIDAFSGFVDFLKKRIPSWGSESFGIGEARFRRKLWFDERVDLPLDSLLIKAQDALAENHETFRQVTAQIDPRCHADEILERLTRDHPPGDQVLRATSAVLDRLREFLVASNVISLPPVDRHSTTNSPCTVEESPEFLKELTFASLAVPGPFEKRSREFFYHVTLPNERWPKEKQEQHLRFFSQHLILTTSIHEAYPGHLLHFLWVNRHPSKVRRTFGAASHVEGWAHYCEEMMIEQGFGGGDPALRLAQLHEAQMRLCRFIVGIEMHVNGMTMRRAKDFFIRNAHMQPANADRETKRGVVDPTYLVYSLGKMQFLRLRADLKKKQGAEFSLKNFHDACVQNGFPPIPLLRELLLHERRAVI
jgi:hypothetical protein